MQPAIFLDRDGTLVRDVRHAADPAALRLLPGVVEALRVLQAAGYRLVVVTNQSGVARGRFTLAEARAMGRWVAALLGQHGIGLAGYYLSPYHVDGIVPRFARSSDCRKPGPGMLRRAADDLGLDLGRSWMIGDTLTDVGAGRAAGARAVLVDIGSQRLGPETPAPPFIARNLPHAARLVLAVDHHLAIEATALPADVLRRPPRRPDRRRTGEPSAWPDDRWADTATADARALVRLLDRVG